MILLDERGAILGVTDYAGGPASAPLPLRRVMADALRLEARAMILSHNHPGGDPTPSRADRALTAAVARVAAALGIRLHDHLIHGNGRHSSFRALGLL